MDDHERVEKKLDENGWRSIKTFVEDDGPPDTITVFGKGTGEQSAYGLLVCVPLPFRKQFLGIHAQGPVPEDGISFDAVVEKVLKELNIQS